jgi:hypothetical protein
MNNDEITNDMIKCRIDSDIRFLLQRPTVSTECKKVLLSIQNKMKTINQGKQSD